MATPPRLLSSITEEEWISRTLGREVTCRTCGELGMVVSIVFGAEYTIRHWRIATRRYGSIGVPLKETYEHVVALRREEAGDPSD